MHRYLCSRRRFAIAESVPPFLGQRANRGRHTGLWSWLGQGWGQRLGSEFAVLMAGHMTVGIGVELGMRLAESTEAYCCML